MNHAHTGARGAPRYLRTLSPRCTSVVANRVPWSEVPAIRVTGTETAPPATAGYPLSPPPVDLPRLPDILHATDACGERFRGSKALKGGAEGALRGDRPHICPTPRAEGFAGCAPGWGPGFEDSGLHRVRRLRGAHAPVPTKYGPAPPSRQSAVKLVLHLCLPPPRAAPPSSRTTSSRDLRIRIRFS